MATLSNSEKNMKAQLNQVDNLSVDIKFLKPIALWYKANQPDTPPRVANAFDSLLAYFEGTEL